MFLNRKSTVLGLAAAAALALSSGTAFAQFTGVSPEVLAAALKEGQVTIYVSSAAPVVDAAIAGFNAAVPGIEVNALRLATAPLTTRYAQEVSAGVNEPDVIDLSATELFETNPDWFAELSATDIPVLADWPASAVKPRYVNAQQGIELIAYNTDLVTGDNIPKTWEDILDPQFKGKGLLIDPRSSNTYLSWLDQMDTAYGPEYIEKLRDQDFTLVEGGTQGVQQVAAGGAMLVIPPAYAHAKPFMDKDAPIAVSMPHESSDIAPIGPQHSWGIPAKAPHPNAAKVFLAWFLSEESQKINCEISGGASALISGYDKCLDPSDAFIPAETPMTQERIDDLLARFGIQ